MSFCTNCGEKVEEGQGICSHCGKPVQINKDKNIFVPIDFSDVRKAIPKAEDIIYSTFCSAQKVGPESFSPGRGYHQLKVTPEGYQSHVLFTKNGIAYQEPIAGLMRAHYIPWYDVIGILVGAFTFTKGARTKLTNYTYTMTPVTKYESLSDFEMRTRRFFFDFVPHVIEEKIKHRSSKGLKRLQKSYDKLKKILGEEECEFFRTNNDYEEFKKRLPKLEKAMLESMPKWAQYIVKKKNLM
ncbi:MAG: zinc-ribbon domain-containing protein [Promethearchaeota archaeon]